jgi:hypothetical protein
VCGGTPCQWDEFGDDLLEQANEMFVQTMSVADDGSAVMVLVNKSSGELVNNNTARYHLYKMFTYLKYGHLGKGNRVRIPSCVQDMIREHFPDPSNQYTGFREPDGNNNAEDIDA